MVVIGMDCVVVMVTINMDCVMVMIFGDAWLCYGCVMGMVAMNIMFSVFIFSHSIDFWIYSWF